MSDIVERLEAHMGKADMADVLPDCREAAAQITRLRDRDEEVREELADAWPEDREAVLDADPAPLIARLIRERDEAICEHEAARSLLEEAGKVVERCQAVLAIMVKPDMTVSSLSAYTACVEAEVAARSLINKMGEAPARQALTGKDG